LLVVLGLAVLDHFKVQVGAFLHLALHRIDSHAPGSHPRKRRLAEFHDGHETY